MSGELGEVLMVAMVFGLLNTVAKPLLVMLSFPFLLLSLGLFLVVINAGLLMATAELTGSLAVAGLGSAVMASVVVSTVSMVLGWLVK